MSTGRKIRVLLVDDHPIVRKGMRALLHAEPDIEVVGEADNGVTAVRMAQGLEPDVILMDLMMPNVDGVDAISRIMQRRPDSRIVVVTSYATDDMLFPAIQAGALGYLLKDSIPEDLVHAIRQAFRGETVLHPQIARRVLQELDLPVRRPDAAQPLTAREMEVLRLVAAGMSNHDIARTLAVSEATVRAHVSSILSKLQLASRVQAALYALREGIATLSDADDPAPR